MAYDDFSRGRNAGLEAKVGEDILIPATGTQGNGWGNASRVNQRVFLKGVQNGLWQRSDHLQIITVLKVLHSPGTAAWLAGLGHPDYSDEFAMRVHHIMSHAQCDVWHAISVALVNA